MNTYNFDVNFTTGRIYGPDLLLVVNDHNSTTFKFTFDQEGRYVFKLLYPDNTIYVQDIINGELVLTKGVLNQEGNYKFEISLYGEDNRLTTARIKEFPVRLELAETDEPVQADDRLPILDNLIEETNKVVEAAKNGEFDGATFTPSVNDNGDLSWTNDKGKENPPTVNIKGAKGDPGAVKMQVVDTLPQIGDTDTIYLLKKDTPGEQNLYDEYVYTETSGWEHIGDTSVDLTDYYTKEETDERLNNKQDALTAGNNITIEDNVISASGGLLADTIDVIKLPNRMDPTIDGGTYGKITDPKYVENINTVLTKLYNTTNTTNFSLILFTDNGGYNDGRFALTKTKYNDIPKKDGQQKFKWHVYFQGFSGSDSLNRVMYPADISFVAYIENGKVRIDDDRISTNYNWIMTPQTYAPSKGMGYKAVYATSGKPLGMYNTESYTPTSNYNPATKKYADDLPKSYTGYDATKTQILKNVNGNLTWVNEG